MRARDPRKLFLRYRKRGDAAALGQVFDLVAPELLALAVHVTKDVSTAEDALQETFLVAVEGADRYDAARPFVPWLVGILVNRARKGRDRRADPRVRANASADTPLDELRSHALEADPARAVAAREVEGLVAEAVDGLQEPYRTVVHKHLDECAPPRDIAVELGRAPGTVRVQLHRGLEQLRAKLGGRDGGGAVGRLSGFGLALPAATQLGGPTPASLSAIREVIVDAASSHAAAVELVHGTSAVPTAAAVVACAAVLAVIASQLGGPSARGGPSIEQQPLVTITAAGDDDVELAPVSGRPRGTLRETVQPPRSRPQRARADDSPEASASGEGPGGAEPLAIPPIDPVPFRLEPYIDLHLVPDIDGSKPTGLSVRDALGESLASTRTQMYGMQPMKIGEFGTPDELRDMVALLDHPDALPEFVAVPRSAWARRGRSYVARVTFKLRPIRSTVTVGTNREAPFRGRVQLRSFDESSSLLLDEQNMTASTTLDGVTLRVPGREPAYALLALPKEEHLSADMIWFETKVPRTGVEEHVLESKLERMQPPTLVLEILDPFQEPMEGIEVRVHVPDEAVTLRAQPSGEPLSIEGWVLASGESVDRSFHARLEASSRRLREIGIEDMRSRKNRVPLVAARHVIREVTGSAGQVTIMGALPGLHALQLKTELNSEPVDMDELAWGRGPDSSTTIAAPIGGIEIAAPAGLLATPEGKAAWQRARVVVDAGRLEVTAERHGPRMFRALVPAHEGLVIRADLGELGTSEAEHTPLGFGGAGRVTLQPVELPVDDPESDGAHRGDAAGAEGGGKG